MGGSNQMIFIITALFVGQGAILGQGSAAVPLLILGVLLGWAAAPAWTELVLMWPNRVGGISAACAEAFRPYNPVLAVLTGTCYWWGWIPTCGLTALLSAAAFQHWYFPDLPVEAFAVAIVCFFTFVNLCGIKWVARLAMPIATASATLAFLSALIPIYSGTVDWHQAFSYQLTVPFEGWFGGLTSVMAGLYLIGFTAPAFEAAACHVGETIDPNKNVPRAMLAAAIMAGVYFIVLPVVWLGVLGPKALGEDLATVLGPTFAPLLGSFGKAAAIWFIVYVPWHAAAARRRRPHHVTAQRRRAAAPVPLLAYREDGLPLGCDGADRHVRDHLPHGGRPGVDDRRGEFHLSHRHLHAERCRLAIAAGHAGCGAPLSGPAGHHHAGRRRCLRLARLGDPGLPAVRPADRGFRASAGLLRSRPLRVARH
jgi:hypothetical protein